MPEGGHLRYRNWHGRFFGSAVERAGIEGVKGFHDLRHTCAALLIDQELDPLDVMRHLGHTDIRTTYNLYGHKFARRGRAVADRLDESIRKAAAEANSDASAAHLLRGEV